MKSLRLKISQILALLWVLITAILAVFFHERQTQIESHLYSQVLYPLYDAFGRNCITLVFSAIFESFKIVIPLGVTAILFAAILSSLTTEASGIRQFLFRTSMDTLLALPGYLIALALGVFFKDPSMTFALATFLLIIPQLVRFFEASILKLQTEEHYLAAKSLGAGKAHLFIYYTWPEILDLMISTLPFTLTRLILIETSLSFLGIGTSPAHDTWGGILYQGKDYFLEAPWILMTASLPLFFTLLAFHLLTRRDQN